MAKKSSKAIVDKKIPPKTTAQPHLKNISRFFPSQNQFLPNSKFQRFYARLRKSSLRHEKDEIANGLGDKMKFHSEMGILYLAK